jgi:hypothetical protein
MGLLGEVVVSVGAMGDFFAELRRRLVECSSNKCGGTHNDSTSPADGR